MRASQLIRTRPGRWKECTATYARNLAAQQGCDACKDNQRAPSDESNRWLHVERVGPHREQRAPLEPCRVVDSYGIGRKAHDGDAAEKGEGSNGYPDGVDHPEGPGLPLKVQIVLRVHLKGGRGSLMLER